MLTRMMAAGLLAGVVSGLFVSGLQQVTTVPLILKAEAYEQAGAKPARNQTSSVNAVYISKLILIHGDAHTDEDTASPSAAPAWTPADGLERTAATTVATVGTAAGFALMLLALMIASGLQITPRSAALWGAAAFFATGLAPGLGLPPELPGSAAADLMPRQLWWFATASATAGGMWLVLRTDRPSRVAAGIALMIAPHVIGAPHPGAFTSTVPAELSSHFTSASLAIHAVLWVVVGAASGYFWQRFNRIQALS